jgi:hypothetical protein
MKCSPGGDDTVAHPVSPEHFPDSLPVADYRERARYRRLRGRSGIGVVVEHAVFNDDSGRRWLCIATDGQRFRHLEAVLPDVPPYAGIPTAAVEAAVEKRATDYPERSRLAGLVNASPLVLTLDEVGGEE